jgi:hypothetical protein
MKILQELAGLFMADKLVMLTVPAAALFGWIATAFCPRYVVALVLLALLATSFSLGVVRAARSLARPGPGLPRASPGHSGTETPV